VFIANLSINTKNGEFRSRRYNFYLSDQTAHFLLFIDISLLVSFQETLSKLSAGR